MKNSLLKIYTISVALIFVGTLVYFCSALGYEYYHQNLNTLTINFYAKISFCIIAFFTALTIIMICLVARYGIKDEEADIIESLDEDPIPDTVSEEEIAEETAKTEASADSEDIDLSIEDDNVEDEPAPLSIKETDIADEENPPVYSDEDLQAVLPVAGGVPGIPVEDGLSNIEELNENLPKPVAEATTNFDGTQTKGLFNPVTGIGWESYLLTRLDNELVRATASEYDLVCFVIKLGNIERNCEKEKVICDYLAEEFQFKDLLFEYKEDSIVALRTNFSIDEAINFAEKIHSHIEGMLDEGENCWIGISSRTIRMVSAERLLKEADQAVLHALEDEDSDIIAFRVNAEKYMQMMESQKN